MPLNARRRRAARLRRSAGIAIAAILAVYLPLTLLAPIPTLAATAVGHTDPRPAAAALAWPAYGESAVGAVGYPGVLATSGSRDARPIASISKIITSLVVLEAKPLANDEAGPTIRFTSADAALVGTYQRMNGETAPMTAGASMSERELMSVALVVSANNYAAVLADWAYGSRAAFVAAATAWLAAHGLAHTTMLEPTGLNPGNRSTADDLVALGKLALANPVIAGIVSTPSLTVPGIGTIANSNKLLGHDGVDGIKTGTLTGSGACLLFAAEYSIGGKKITVVGAVLGGVDHAALDVDVRSLLRSVKAGFHDVALTSRGEAFATYSTPWKQEARAVATTAASIVVWGDPAIASAVAAKSIRLSAKGAPVGEVTFTVDDQKISVPLALDHGIQDPGAWWRLTNPMTLPSRSG
jgi:D-alanyl-D-alanine carboxypeptidase (penicillin-binding protein 5/6)